LFKSPQVLELSVIGHPDVLEKAQIPYVLVNPHVGNNIQEKTMFAVCMIWDPGKHP
jgi:choline dehydrogenase-like flavoprotein